MERDMRDCTRSCDRWLPHSCAIPVAFAVALAGVVAGTLAVALAVVLAVALAVAVGVAGTLAVAVAFAVGVAGTLAGTIALAVAGTGTVALAIIFFLLSIYIAYKALKGDEKYAIIRTSAIAFAAFGGTSFRNADLTDADFTQASLKSTDFRKADLTRTCFEQVKKLDRVRPGTSYLQHATVRQVLIAGQGREKNFDRFDLRGVNFRGAYLTDASFVAADLSNACFQDTDLSRAKLVQAQLDGTDFTGVTLTGAFIEDWNITNQTNFTGVTCEYVFMRLPTKLNPDPLRKPDNREEVFGDGQFGDFIKPILDTLDLYHSQGVDPRAIAIAFKTLAENNPDAELRIVGMEVKGEDKFLLRAKTITTDKSRLSAEYFDTYNQVKSLSEREVKLLLAEKDSRISSLENMVGTALQRHSFYAENYRNEGGTMSDKTGDSTYNFNNPKFGGGFAGTGGSQTGGTYYDYSSNQNLVEAANEIQSLLRQLLADNPITTNADKMAVVVKAVDEIEKNPTLKSRAIAALKSGGTEAFKEAVNHPLVNILVAIISGWTETQ